MADLRTVLLAKADGITDIWIRDVSRNLRKKHDVVMTYEAVRNRLPMIIESVARQLPTALSDYATSQTIEPRASEQTAGKQAVNQKPVDTRTAHLNRQTLARAAAPESSTHVPDDSRNAINVELGFDVDEMLREFSILRRLILTAIAADFSTADISEAAITLQQIDAILNGITARSARRHAEYQLARVEPMHRELLSSNQELIRLVQMQKDNAAHLAHELKNPLNSIIAFSSLLLQKKQKLEIEAPLSLEAVSKEGISKEIKQLERIYENGKQIFQLINNMLEVSRKESQQLSLKVEMIDPAELVTKVVDSLASLASKKAIALSVDCETAPPLAKTDRLRLQQIIVNLVSNAIRYTDRGSIQVSCYGIEDQRWSVSVQDTGRGIDQQQQAEIFEPYVRVSAAGTYSADSTGLGLAIVSKLVDLLHGEIVLQSELGKGSTFTVTLPLDID